MPRERSINGMPSASVMVSFGLCSRACTKASSITSSPMAVLLMVLVLPIAYLTEPIYTVYTHLKYTYKIILWWGPSVLDTMNLDVFVSPSLRN